MKCKILNKTRSLSDCTAQHSRKESFVILATVTTLNLYEGKVTHIELDFLAPL